MRWGKLHSQVRQARGAAPAGHMAWAQACPEAQAVHHECGFKHCCGSCCVCIEVVLKMGMGSGKGRRASSGF